MDIISAIALGVVQGITEFLPISSSAHLILLREVFGFEISNALAFDAVLQLATTLAVILYFWRDLWNVVCVRNEKNNILVAAIVAGTIPAVIVGFLFEDQIDMLFRNVHTVAWALIAGSVLFFIAEIYASMNARRDTAIEGSLLGREMTIGRGVLIGLFQILAFVPGMSRSGSTISGGLLLGLKREDVVRFSFLLSVPILLGSGLKKLIDLSGEGNVDAALVVGSIAAFFVGLASIHFLIIYLRRHTLNAFVVYRIMLALAILLFL